MQRIKSFWYSNMPPGRSCTNDSNSSNRSENRTTTSRTTTTTTTSRTPTTKTSNTQGAKNKHAMIKNWVLLVQPKPPGQSCTTDEQQRQETQQQQEHRQEQQQAKQQQRRQQTEQQHHKQQHTKRARTKYALIKMLKKQQQCKVGVHDKNYCRTVSAAMTASAATRCKVAPRLWCRRRMARDRSEASVGAMRRIRRRASSPMRPWSSITKGTTVH